MLAAALAELHALARPSEVAGMARFGINPNGRIGVAVPELRRLGKRIGCDAALAEALWATGIPDARILASLVADPKQLTSRRMDAWAGGFDSWDVCDQACGNAFARSPLAWNKVHAWAPRQAEFVRRAAFALLAQLAVHDKAADEARFVEAFALIEAASDVDCNFVRKAVNWALRQIGKRNLRLRRAAMAEAKRMTKLDSRAARWIAADALRELRIS